MNWYFEVQGVSKGPYPEEDFAQMARRGDVPSDSLIWKPGMAEWATIREINPSWLQSTQATEPASKKERNSAPARKSSLPKDNPTEEALPVIEAAIPTEVAAPVRAPAQSKLKLQAPTPAPESSGQQAEKSGLLKRVFGFGGKKKS